MFVRNSLSGCSSILSGLLNTLSNHKIAVGFGALLGVSCGFAYDVASITRIRHCIIDDYQLDHAVEYGCTAQGRPCEGFLDFSRYPIRVNCTSPQRDYLTRNATAYFAVVGLNQKLRLELLAPPLIALAVGAITITLSAYICCKDNAIPNECEFADELDAENEEWNEWSNSYQPPEEHQQKAESPSLLFARSLPKAWGRKKQKTYAKDDLEISIAPKTRLM